MKFSFWPYLLSSNFPQRSTFLLNIVILEFLRYRRLNLELFLSQQKVCPKNITGAYHRSRRLEDSIHSLTNNSWQWCSVVMDGSSFSFCPVEDSGESLSKVRFTYETAKHQTQFFFRVYLKLHFQETKSNVEPYTLYQPSRFMLLFGPRADKTAMPLLFTPSAIQ